jgi:hypothetical protein
MSDEEKDQTNSLLVGFQKLDVPEACQLAVISGDTLQGTTARGARLLATWVEPRDRYSEAKRVFLVALSEVATLAAAQHKVDEADRQRGEYWRRCEAAESATKVITKELSEMRGIISTQLEEIAELRRKLAGVDEAAE